MIRHGKGPTSGTPSPGNFARGGMAVWRGTVAGGQGALVQMGSSPLLLAGTLAVPIYMHTHRQPVEVLCRVEAYRSVR
jgi:hypothetical protein